MKRIIAFFLVILCVLAFVSCDEEHEEITDQAYFYAEVVEKHEKSCLVVVTELGNQSFFVGDEIIVNTDIEKCPEYDVGDCLRIVFDGAVAESYPLQIHKVSEIHVTDKES